MPIYEYQCGQCEHKLETIQKLSEDPLKECPECGESSLRKLISAVSFRLKGTGWYETDFKDKDKAKDKKDGNNNDSAKKSEKKTETASKAESKDTSSNSSKKAETKSKTSPD